MVPVLLMERNTLEVALNPVSPLVPGAEGAVDLYLVPAYDDIASLYFERGQWVIHYAFPSAPDAARSEIDTTRLPLSEETINQVLNAILSHGGALGLGTERASRAGRVFTTPSENRSNPKKNPP